MSGGRFDYWSLPDNLSDCWQDEEVNELVQDLFCNDTFSVRGYGGLMQTLDFALSGDVEMQDYKKSVSEFKKKWFGKTPKNRVQFYADKLQSACDEYKKQLSM